MVYNIQELDTVLRKASSYEVPIDEIKTVASRVSKRECIQLEISLPDCTLYVDGEEVSVVQQKSGHRGIFLDVTKHDC